MRFLLVLLQFGLVCVGIILLFSVLQFILPVLICGGVIAGIVYGIVYLWNASSSAGEFFITLFQILGILIGSGVVIYVLGKIFSFFGAISSSDNTSAKPAKKYEEPGHSKAGLFTPTHLYCKNCSHYSEYSGCTRFAHATSKDDTCPFHSSFDKK